MFVDYYAILEIDCNANESQIKAAFKNQALKWHPDRNPGKDTTFRMQIINEAYLILKDVEARSRYDSEYQKFQAHRKKEEAPKYRSQDTPDDEVFYDNTFSSSDDLLEKWMANARKQAADLAKQTLEDIKNMSNASGRAMVKEMQSGVCRLIIFSIVVLFFIKSCGK